MNIASIVSEQVPEIINDVSIGAKAFAAGPDTAPGLTALMNSQTLILGALAVVSGIILWKTFKVITHSLTLAPE